jgi:hypothetical protein
MLEHMRSHTRTVPVLHYCITVQEQGDATVCTLAQSLYMMLCMMSETLGSMLRCASMHHVL